MSAGPNTHGDSGLGPGGIAGIVIGCVAALALILLIAGFFAYRRYKEHVVSYQSSLHHARPAKDR